MEKTPSIGRTIEKDLYIACTPERVFQALTEKAELEHWFVKQVTIDARPGGALRFEFAPDVVETGTILVLEPSHRVSYTWDTMGPSPTTVNFAMTAENEGTRLHMSQTGIGEGEDWNNYYTALNSGWDVYCKNLTIWLETGVGLTLGPTGNIKNH